MRIIVVGGGKVGAALCRSLVDENHNVILIEQKEAVLTQVVKHNDIIGIIGNGANFRILEQADVANCDIFVSITDKDEVNMIAASLAKQMGAKKTIVRVRNPEYSNPYFKEKNFLGFSLMVNPELLTARYIANAVEFPNALSVEHFVNGRIMLMAFKIKNNSVLSNMTLSQFRKKFQNIVICAIEREDQIIIPDGEVTILNQDKIYVTGNRQEMIAFHDFLKKRIVKSLMIIGAGKIAYYLLTLLKQTKIKLKLIEIDPKRAALFSEDFPNIHIVQGDGTTKNLLLEERADHYDAVATLTGVDEENIVASMFLDSLGVAKNITKVNRTSLLKIIKGEEFSSIVTPKAIAVDAIMHFIRGRVNAQHSNLDAMHHVANGRIETLQFEIRENNRMAGQTLSSIKLKKNVLIAAIIRQGKNIFPTGEDVFQVGDKIVVITLLNNANNIYDLLR
ncbi:Trk system potassium transporter TrkA [Streptococcus pacificus]|uniref:Trk system potassium uptake protein TrkA n=1 Tax=Streptococcus pacificus TaxID=2740577 RepID=A0ABS0ZJA9_9STRE|nr:Trk system potassium transporter TrkA [Streptococcus pacificus]MBJ8326079.1 Trk system potassium transporter TrkA [Streptococcus pacificus]